MKRTIATAVLAVLTSQAHADDWSGLFASLEGYGSFVTIDEDLGAQTSSYTKTGFLGGVNLAYNFESNNIIFGPEFVALFGSDAKTITETTTFAGGFEFDDTFDLDQLYLANARVGVAKGAMLFHVSGGLAIGHMKVGREGFNGSGSTRTPNALFTFSGDEFHTGFNLGAGFDIKVSPKASLGLSYRYVDIDLDGHDFNNGGSLQDTSFQTHMVGARLSYRFH